MSRLQLDLIFVEECSYFSIAPHGERVKIFAFFVSFFSGCFKHSYFVLKLCYQI